MTPSLFDLPVRTGDAGKIAHVLFEHGQRPLNDDLRGRLGVRMMALGLESIRPFPGSIERDPIHSEAFYLAVNGVDDQPLMLRMAPGSSPSSALFPKSVLIGRLRVGPQEVVINAIPFSPRDSERIRTFAWEVNPAFLPKAQGTKATLSAPVEPGIFEQFRAAWKPRGLNVSCVSGDFDTILWEAIRSGWREGYVAESTNADVAGFSRYILPPSSDLPARLEQIARARVPLKLGRTFDWELAIDGSATPEDADRVIEECRAAGKPPSFLSFPDGRVPEQEDWLALVKRHSLGVAFRETEPDLADTARSLGGRFTVRLNSAAGLVDMASAIFG